MARLLLKEMLKKRKMTRYRFAKLLDMEYQNARRYLKPGYDPKLSVLTAWAKVLKCRVRDLIKE